MKTTLGPVVVLNASLEPFGTVDFLHAVKMVNRKVARIVDYEAGRQFGKMPYLKVIALVKYVYKKWLDRPAKWHRGGVFIRDGHRCAYCNKKATTIDHIHPRSKGGEWSWTNCVAACVDCNGRKSNLTLEEAGMRLQYATPYVPTNRELGRR